MFLKTPLITGCCMLCSITTANATDLAPINDPAVITPVLESRSFSGFYAGVQIGATWLEGGDVRSSHARYKFDTKNEGGFQGGAFGGYNYQNSKIVFGVEMSADAGSAKTDLTSLNEDYSGNIKKKWSGSLRGRIGVAPIDGLPILAYATAGPSVGSFSQLINYTPFAASPGRFSKDNTVVGWQIGGGVEGNIGQYIGSGETFLRTQYMYGQYKLPNSQTAEFSTKGIIKTQEFNFGLGQRF